jgi:AcrR family transcriptional regulator
MAAKKATKAKAPRKSQSPIADRIIEASMKIASEQGWQSLTLNQIADTIGEPLGAVIGVYPTTDRIASALFHRIDQQVLSQVDDVDESETARDRLFEILMMRFDALQERRTLYVSIVHHMRRRPAALVLRAPAVVHSMALMLIASGIEASSVIGMARAHVLAAAYGTLLRTWLKDDSPDMAQTMSAVDRVLNRLESAQRMVCRFQSKEKDSEDHAGG